MAELPLKLVPFISSSKKVALSVSSKSKFSLNYPNMDLLIVYSLPTCYFFAHAVVVIRKSRIITFLDYGVEDTALPLQPSVNYTVPELVPSGDSKLGFTCDIFSFGCLAYHLVSHRPLLDCHNNMKMVSLLIWHMLCQNIMYLIWTSLYL
jgi:hypothetical protein